jgi:hypothetical protein
MSGLCNVIAFSVGNCIWQLRLTRMFQSPAVANKPAPSTAPLASPPALTKFTNVGPLLTSLGFFLVFSRQSAKAKSTLLCRQVYRPSCTAVHWAGRQCVYQVRYSLAQLAQLAVRVLF